VVRKVWGNRISVCLVYPNSYQLGMSNLGFQTVYAQLNRIDHVVCERAFLTEDHHGSKGNVSIESGRAFRDFDIIAFSVSFENDFPNILNILRSCGIPWLSDHRSDNHPLIVGGGVACFSNPEPIAPFFDLFFLGESEGMLDDFFKLYDPAENRHECIVKIARNVSGIYVPSFYKVSYHDNGTLSAFEPIEDVPKTIPKIRIKDLSDFSTTSTLLTDDTTFGETFLIEVSRGCAHGCRFCSAGFIYRPPRFRPLSLLAENIATGACITNQIGLMGAAVSDHPDIEKLCALAHEKNLQLSFSSLRADSLSGELVQVLKKSRIKTATIAPDAGSERMLNVINKGITADQIYSAVETLVAAGIPNLKLYFMVGLPTETTEDVKAIVTMCKKIKHGFLKFSRPQKRIGEITVSLNSFVPKPVTPFQWAAMDDILTLKKKIKMVKDGLRKVPNVRVHADMPRWAFLQGLFSRADRKVSMLIAQAVENEGNWPKTFKESALNPDFYTLRKRFEDEIFPWDFIDHGIDKSFLLKEYHQALNEKTSPPCPIKESCTICGACKKR
jgi:radical SAM family uncharacterized protein